MKHVLWLGKDNSVAFQVLSAGKNLATSQYDAISRVVIRLHAIHSDTVITLDSAQTSQLFSWGPDRITLHGSQLGEVPDVDEGLYFGRIIVYSNDHPGGVVVADGQDYSVTIKT